MGLDKIQILVAQYVVIGRPIQDCTQGVMIIMWIERY